MRMNKEKYDLSPEQLVLVNKYCEDELRLLKKICLPLIAQKGVAEMEYDDLIDDAMKVLLETASTYNKEINSNFGAVLTMNIKRSYKDWIRDRMRDKRVNYARDKEGNIIYEEYEVNGEKKKRKVIIKSLTLDATTEEGREIKETIASDFKIENIFFRETINGWHKEVIEYLDLLSPLQRKIILMIANNYNKNEICEILHIEENHYDNLLKKIKSSEKTWVLMKLI